VAASWEVTEMRTGAGRRRHELATSVFQRTGETKEGLGGMDGAYPVATRPAFKGREGWLLITNKEADLQRAMQAMEGRDSGGGVAGDQEIGQATAAGQEATPTQEGEEERRGTATEANGGDGQELGGEGGWVGKVDRGKQILFTYSDGSVVGEMEERRASYGWVIGGQDAKVLEELGKGGGRVRGRWQELDSTRAEAEGILDMMRELREKGRLGAGFKVVHTLDNQACVHTWYRLGKLTARQWLNLEHKDVWRRISKERSRWEGRGEEFVVRWHRGHKERREADRSKWNRHDVGNDLSDKVADDWMEEGWGTPPGGRRVCRSRWTERR
jgi:hypothetical protein